MAAVVSFNSFGTKVTRTSTGNLTPVPPISNCLGKMVFLVVAAAAADTIGAITGATYYALGTGAVSGVTLAVFYKNGEAVEPTPSVAITDASAGQKIAQICVLDVTGGSFPAVAAAGDARLATANSRNGTTAGINYTGLASHIGLGYLLAFGSRGGLSTGTTTAVATTAGWTQILFGASAINYNVIAAQLRNAATVAAGSEAAHAEAITTNTETTNFQAYGLTVEMAVTQAAAAGGPFTGKFGAPFRGKLAA